LVNFSIAWKFFNRFSRNLYPIKNRQNFTTFKPSKFL
jgi:hypothetical protein